MTVDSAKWLLKDTLRCLGKVDEILSFIGIFYIGKITVATTWDVVTGLRIHVWSKICHRSVENFGKWAVVGGVSGWAGRGYAEVLAQKGMNVLFLSDNPASCNVAQNISKAYGVEAEVVTTDGATGASPRILQKHLSHKDIGVLVVSTMVGGLGAEEGTSEEIRMVGSLVSLLLPGMVDRDRGGAIILVCPPPHTISTPHTSHLYSAVKCYVKEYSRAVEEECKSSGVAVQVVTPFGPPQYLAKICQLRLTQWVMESVSPDANQFASAALTTLGHTRCTSGHWTHASLNWAMEQIPVWLTIGSFFLVYKFVINKNI